MTEITDIERIERMFTKAAWLIGIVWTLTLGAGAIAFITSFSYLDSLVTNAETKLEKVSQRASEKIDSAADDVTKKLAFDVSKKIDIVKLSEEIKNEKIPAIEKELESSVAKIKNKLEGDLNTISADINLTKMQVDKYTFLLSEMLELQKIAEDMQVVINTVSIGPTIPRVGGPAQLISQIYAPTTNNKQIIKGKLVIRAFDEVHESEITLLGRNSLDVSIPIIIPNKSKTNGILNGEGSYAIDITVLTRNGGIILAHKSSLERVYRAE